MSFILEALKKSEKNRQKSSAPTLATQHHKSVQVPTKRPLWIGVLVLFVLFFNGAILIWLLGPWQQIKTQPQNQPLETSTYINAEDTETTTEPAAQTESLTAVETQPTVVPQPPKTIVTVDPISPPKQSQPAVTIAETVPAPKLPIAITIDELPAHIQQQLPPFIMSAHGYAGNNNSLIRLNNKIMRQGSTLDGRYRLEEITAEGATLSYQGYWFKILR